MRISSWLTAFLLLLAPLPALAAGDETSKDSTPSDINGKSLDQWIKEIRDPDPGVVENAIRTLLLFGKEAHKGGPNLIYRLDAKDTSVRANAAAVLGLIGPDLYDSDRARAVEKLAVKMTDDSQTIVRYHATLALYRIGKDAKAVRGKLILATKDTGTFEVRRYAVMALAIVGIDADQKMVDPRSLGALMAAVNDSSALVRLEAVVALGSVGRYGSDAEIPTIKQALLGKFKDKDAAVGMWARAGFMNLDGYSDKLVKEIAKNLKDKDAVVRSTTIRILSVFGDKAKVHVPDLIEMLYDKQVTVSTAAAVALTLMGPSADKALPVLAELLQKTDLNPALRQALMACQEKLKAKK